MTVKPVPPLRECEKSPSGEHVFPETRRDEGNPSLPFLVYKRFMGRCVHCGEEAPTAPVVEFPLPG